MCLSLVNTYLEYMCLSLVNTYLEYILTIPWIHVPRQYIPWIHSLHWIVWIQTGIYSMHTIMFWYYYVGIAMQYWHAWNNDMCKCGIYTWNNIYTKEGYWLKQCIVLHTTIQSKFIDISCQCAYTDLRTCLSGYTYTNIVPMHSNTAQYILSYTLHCFH